MNLMFWKKKTGAGEDSEGARENSAVNTKPQEALDFAAVKHDVTERNPESPDPEATDPEAKPGLVARMKLWLTALPRHFRKAPAFRAEEDHIPDAPGDSGKPADAAAAEPEPESLATETPVSPGLSVRIKLQLIALIRRFRKMPAPATSEDQHADSHERSEATSEGEHPEDISDTGSARSRKRLVIGGAIGLLVLLLAGIWIAIWPASAPSTNRWGTKHDMTSLSPSIPQPESAPVESKTEIEAPKKENTPEKFQTEIEALKKENAELQARIEALKKGQQPYATPARQAGENIPSSSASGEMTVGNKDPKATAMSLKEAIEAMNASSGDYRKKPVK